MIILKKKMLSLLKRKVVWFGDAPKVSQCLTTVYKQSLAMKNFFGYKRDDFYTKLIDISGSDEQLILGFDKQTAYDIRRGRKDGISSQIHNGAEEFVVFYNDFAKTKGLNTIDLSKVDYGGNLMITKAVIENDTLVMHSYILDPSLRRVRLLHSASLYRNEETGASKRSLVGRANRLLHLEDMSLFRSQGYKIYDMGGYAYQTTDSNLLRINVFKDGFGGEMVLESDYWPLTFIYLMRLFAFLKATGNKIGSKMSANQVKKDIPYAV